MSEYIYFIEQKYVFILFIFEVLLANMVIIPIIYLNKYIYVSNTWVSYNLVWMIFIVKICNELNNYIESPTPQKLRKCI